MNWTQALDFYCERTSELFWSEPLNAISNAGFIFAGFWGLRQLRESHDIWLGVLSVLAIKVGIGSFLFHTFANRWSHLADIVPIGILMSIFVGYVVRVLLKQSQVMTAVSVIAFMLLSGFIQVVNSKDVLNGSLGYAHGFVMLGLIVAYRYKKKTHDRRGFLNAYLLFCLALVFRTLDHVLCPWIPFGTHFLWHLLNGALVWQILVIVSYNQRHQRMSVS